MKTKSLRSLEEHPIVFLQVVEYALGLGEIQQTTTTTGEPSLLYKQSEGQGIPKA